jgi:hypothetical protein
MAPFRAGNFEIARHNIAGPIYRVAVAVRLKQNILIYHGSSLFPQVSITFFLASGKMLFRHNLSLAIFL